MSLGEPIQIAAMIAILPVRMEDRFAALATSPDQFRSTPRTNMLSLSHEREIATLRADSIFIGTHGTAKPGNTALHARGLQITRDVILCDLPSAPVDLARSLFDISQAWV